MRLGSRSAVRNGVPCSPILGPGGTLQFFHRKAYPSSLSTACLRDVTGKWVAGFSLMRLLWVLLVQGRESLSTPGRDTDDACPLAVVRSCAAISKFQWYPLSLTLLVMNGDLDTPLNHTSSISYGDHVVFGCKF